MDKPVTLGDWFKILRVDDFNEASTLLANRTTPPEWLPAFLMQWAPEVIMQRERMAGNVSRVDIMDKLAAVEALAAQLAALLGDPAVMKFLQMPPHRPFQSELGARMFASEILVRAHDAATSPILLRGDGKENSGAGKAVTTDDVSPEQLCGAIVGEVWCALHGSYPIAFQDAAAAASAYWMATGGTTERSFGSSPVSKWRPYFKKLQDEQFLWGCRKELKRQLLS